MKNNSLLHSQGQTHLLKSQRFLPLFITQFFGAFNDNIFKNAFLIWFTYDIAFKLKMDAQLMVTIASGLFVLPFFLFSALAGQVADKFEKFKIVHIIKIAEIALMIFVFVGFYFESVYLLLLLVFLMGAHSTFFGPIKYSLLPEVLKDNELVSGNAFVEGGLSWQFCSEQFLAAL
jgi:acyl-[acyl-carrier-protein]-phospholipid O-acyltransferase/long-chain-fatty-acid--[acyl-carrier-protein] ligase